MTMRTRIRTLIGFWVLGITLTAMVSACEADDTAQATYVTYGCQQCHGFAGQGSAAGPRLAPNPLPFDAFAEFVRRPPNRMPAYSPNVLGDEDLSRIYAYVEQIAEPPAAADIPLLNELAL